MHVFKYSQRKGTKAAVMKDQISGDVKEHRSKTLLQLSDENEKKYKMKYIEKEVDVLFEEFDETYYKGHTSNYIMVKAESKENISNKILNVRIIDIKNNELIGVVWEKYFLLQLLSCE